MRDIYQYDRDVLLRIGKPSERISNSFNLLKWKGSQPDTAVIFENGLGLSYECWDWMLQRVPKEYTVILSNREITGSVHRRSTMSRTEELLNQELENYKRHIFVAHSIGALVLAGRLENQRTNRNKSVDVWLIDPTDTDLLKASENNRISRQRIAHVLHNNLLTALSGTNQLDAKLVKEINFRASVEKKYLSRIRSARTAYRVIKE